MGGVSNWNKKETGFNGQIHHVCIDFLQTYLTRNTDKLGVSSLSNTINIISYEIFY